MPKFATHPVVMVGVGIVLGYYVLPRVIARVIRVKSS